jgi:hypothetical protein
VRTRKLKTTTKKNLEDGAWRRPRGGGAPPGAARARGPRAWRGRQRPGSSSAGLGLRWLLKELLSSARRLSLPCYEKRAHRHALVLDGVRRGFRRELARVDQPAQRLPLPAPLSRCSDAPVGNGAMPRNKDQCPFV